MAERGVHFALTPEQEARLLAAAEADAEAYAEAYAQAVAHARERAQAGDEAEEDEDEDEGEEGDGDEEGDAVQREVDALEAAWASLQAEGWLCETDKAWDPIHRCFCKGKLLYEGGESPLNLLVCGGRQLSCNDDYTVSLVTADQVAAVAQAAAQVTREGLRQRYGQIKQRGYAHRLGEADFDDAWANFQDLTAFFARAAAAGRAVIFTVDA
ncbi:DUF1877 family protein [Comamonas serinivorans]|nr:DUF1877 family protein [Comamonas serinivorans]